MLCDLICYETQMTGESYLSKGQVVLQDLWKEGSEEQG